MSRFHNDDWDGDELPWEFWHRTVENAIKGKRGQVILRELKEALLVLPKPRLIKDSLVCEGEVCALGALAAHRLAAGPISLHRGYFNRTPVTDLRDLEERFGESITDEFTIVEFGQEMGLTGALAWAISHENDEGCWNEETPEKRYQRMLYWVDQQLGEAETKPDWLAQVREVERST